MQARSVHHAASSVHHACMERTDCLPGRAKMPVRNGPNPCSGLAEGQLAPTMRLPEATKRAFSSPESPFPFSFKCKDFAIHLPYKQLQHFVSVFPSKPGGRPEKRILTHQRNQSVKMQRRAMQAAATATATTPELHRGRIENRRMGAWTMGACTPDRASATLPHGFQSGPLGGKRSV